MGTAMIGAHPFGHLLRAEQTGRFDNCPLTVDPLGLNRVEPGTLDGQVADEEADALALLLDGPVVCADPGAHRLTHVPGRIVPDEDPHWYAQGLQPGAAPVQKLGCQGADGPALYEAQPNGFVLLGAAHEQAITGQRLRIGIGVGDRLFHQAQRLVGLRPGVQVGLPQATPPHLVGEAQRPVRMGAGQSDQTVALSFFRTYSGSGLVIHCLARFQPMPSRSKVLRMASPLTTVGVKPWAQLTSAAKSSVHRLVGWSKSRGLRCSSARNCSARSSENARGGGRCGREEPFWSAASPWALKACSAS